MHWNDEQGPLLAVNAVTNDAVDADSLQPELKVCAVTLRPLELPPNKAEFESEAMMHSLDDSLGRLVVLWASQTGNAEELAIRLVDDLGVSGIPGRLVDMSRCRLSDIVGATDILVVTSTFGDGGPPDNGSDFWEQLQSADSSSLNHARYSVLGIGDRSYSQFCRHARILDERLGELGATRLVDRVECEINDDGTYERWIRNVVVALGGSVAELTTSGASTERVTAPFTRAQPVRSRLVRNVRLTPASSNREVRQFGFDISEHAVGYGVGDALGVHPTNCARDVDNWLMATGTSGEETVEVDGTLCSWREALTNCYDICRITPDLVRFIAERSVDKAVLKSLRMALDALERWSQGRNGLDVVRMYSVRATVAQWQAVLIRLTPRFYSISSSPLVHPHEVQLMVSIVRYQGLDGTVRGGVCSTFMADRAEGQEIPIFLQKSPHFRPPDDPSTPMVMIGAGTGISPFHGFLQHRRVLGDRAKNWLFFGDRHKTENFYHRDDLTKMVDDGFLTNLDLAFSRDQQQRIYVQHKMIEQGRQLWAWLQDGAHIYVCGDASRTAHDVDAALTSVIRTHGRMSRDGAKDYKLDLVASKRYVRDVY
jgi:sulfite reductase (NADPH) flavoprotein alpha-component